MINICAEASGSSRSFSLVGSHSVKTNTICKNTSGDTSHHYNCVYALRHFVSLHVVLSISLIVFSAVTLSVCLSLIRYKKPGELLRLYCKLVAVICAPLNQHVGDLV